LRAADRSLVEKGAIADIFVANTLGLMSTLTWLVDATPPPSPVEFGGARKRGLEPADPHVHDLRIGTLHSLCDALLAEFDDVYMAAGTQVIDETETRVRMARRHRWTLGFTGRQPGRTVDRLLESEELVALFRPPWNEGRWPAIPFSGSAFSWPCSVNSSP
jgi:hypothetical protein